MDFEIGDRVSAGSKVGILRFCGETSFAEGIWAGIELSTPDGKNDGSLNDVRYFECEPNHGLFCRADKVTAAPARSRPPRESVGARRQSTAPPASSTRRSPSASSRRRSPSTGSSRRTSTASYTQRAEEISPSATKQAPRTSMASASRGEARPGSGASAMIESLRKEKAVLEDRVKELEAECEAARGTVESEQAAREEDRRSAERELAVLKATLDKSRDQRASGAEAADNERADLLLAIEEMKLEVKAQEQRASKAETLLSEQRKEAEEVKALVGEERDLLQEELGSLKRELEELTNHHAQAKELLNSKAEECSSNEETVTALNDRIAKLEAEREQFEIDRDEMELKVDEMDLEMESLKEQLEVYKTAGVSAGSAGDSVLASLEAQNAKLTAALKKVHETSASEKAELSKKLKVAERAAQFNEAAASERDELLEQTSRFTEDITELQMRLEEASQAEESLELLTEEKLELDERCADLASRMEQMKELLNEADETRELLEEEKEFLQDELNEARKVAERSDALRSEVDVRHEDTKERLADLERTIEKMKRANASLRGDNESLTERLQSTGMTADSLRSEARDAIEAQAKLRDARAEIRELTQRIAAAQWNEGLASFKLARVQSLFPKGFFATLSQTMMDEQHQSMLEEEEEESDDRVSVETPRRRPLREEDMLIDSEGLVASVLAKLGFVLERISLSARDWLAANQSCDALSQRSRELLVAHVHATKDVAPRLLPAVSRTVQLALALTSPSSTLSPDEAAVTVLGASSALGSLEAYLDDLMTVLREEGGAIPPHLASLDRLSDATSRLSELTLPAGSVTDAWDSTLHATLFTSLASCLAMAALPMDSQDLDESSLVYQSSAVVTSLVDLLAQSSTHDITVWRRAANSDNPAAVESVRQLRAQADGLAASLWGQLGGDSFDLTALAQPDELMGVNTAPLVEAASSLSQLTQSSSVEGLTLLNISAPSVPWNLLQPNRVETPLSRRSARTQHFLSNTVTTLPELRQTTAKLEALKAEHAKQGKALGVVTSQAEKLRERLAVTVETESSSPSHDTEALKQDLARVKEEKAELLKRISDMRKERREPKQSAPKAASGRVPTSLKVELQAKTEALRRAKAESTQWKRRCVLSLSRSLPDLPSLRPPLLLREGPVVANSQDGEQPTLPPAMSRTGASVAQLHGQLASVRREVLRHSMDIRVAKLEPDAATQRHTGRVSEQVLAMQAGACKLARLQASSIQQALAALTKVPALLPTPLSPAASPLSQDSPSAAGSLPTIRPLPTAGRASSIAELPQTARVQPASVVGVLRGASSGQAKHPEEASVRKQVEVTPSELRAIRVLFGH